MTTTHLILRYAHISMGLLSLASGAGAMILRKGSARHKQSGNIFFVAMLIMAATGFYMSIFITPNLGNVMGGLMAFYLTATAWLTVWRNPGRTGALEVVAAVLGFTTATVGITCGLLAANSPTGKLDSYPPAMFFIFGSIALFGSILDARMIARGGLTGAARLTRHLWRMCVAMFFATASFFLGQAKLFPAAVRESGVLPVPVLLVIGALIFWLIRIRVWPLLKRTLASRRAVAGPRMVAAKGLE